jgi:hypothetical protein
MSKNTVNTEGLIAAIVFGIIVCLLLAHGTAICLTNPERKMDQEEIIEPTTDDEQQWLDHLGEHHDSSFWNAI